MSVPGPNGTDVKLAVGQWVQLRNGWVVQITGRVDGDHWPYRARSRDGEFIWTENGYSSEDESRESDSDIVRVLAHSTETKHGDGTTTKVVTIPVTMPDEVWDKYDVDAYRRPITHEPYMSSTTQVSVRGPGACGSAMVLRPKTPPIDPNVMALVEAIEAGTCEIPSRVTSICRRRDGSYILYYGPDANHYTGWKFELLGSRPDIDAGVRVDMNEVRSLIEERKGGAS